MDSNLKIILLNDNVVYLEDYIRKLKLKNESDIEFYNRISNIKVNDNKYVLLINTYILELKNTIFHNNNLNFEIIDKLTSINIFDSILLFRTENDNNKLFTDCIYYLLDLFSNVKDNICKAEIYKLGIILSIINVPFYIITKYLDLFKNNINKDDIFEFLINSSLFHSINISNIYQYSKILNKNNKNVWRCISNSKYDTEYIFDRIFKFYNQNSQKTLKQLIKSNRLYHEHISEDMDININIIKSLLKNNQNYLLKLYCEINEIDSYFKYKEVFAIVSTNEKMLLSYLDYNKHNLSITEWIDMFQYLKLNNQYISHYKLIEIYTILINNCDCVEELIYSSTDYCINILNIISTLKKGYILFDRIEEKIKKNIKYDNANDNWSCLLTSCRYSDYDTFKYILNRMENKMVYKIHGSFVYDILGCSLTNTDERIYKYVLKNCELFDINMKEFLNKNILDSIEILLFSNVKIALKYKKERLKYIIGLFKDEIENNYILERVIKYKYKYESVLQPFMKWIILELMTPFKNKDYDTLLNDFEITDNSNDVLCSIINDIDIILSEKIDIICLYGRCLLKNGWFDKSTQYLLSIIPNLSELNILQQQIIMNSLIHHYWTEYYTNRNDIYSVVFILKQNNFNLNEIVFQFHNKELKIINYILSTSMFINKDINRDINKYIHRDIIDVLLLSGVSLYSIDTKLINYFNYNFILRKWYIIYNTLNRYYKRKQKHYKMQFNKKYYKVKSELLYRPPKIMSNNTNKINEKGSYIWLYNFNKFQDKLCHLSLKQS